ncbi:MAG: TIGR04013 family B12-binding domain/radical SAM domain-containing protein [Candidatus Thorarchaeota archaeon]|nr:TIGR04013 family B12-binding domain/radical SAM domain-containing protein [Candidatus Thorarchaeota archaeon]
MRVRSLGVHSLIFRAHTSSRYSVAALLGSVEVDSRLQSLNIHAPIDSPDSLIRQGIGHGNVVVAHSVMSTQTNRITHEVRHIKKEFDNRVILVAGGPHASARPSELIEMGFDYVVIGEGESSFRELLYQLLNDSDPISVPGVVSKDSDTFPLPKSLPRITLDDYPPFALGMNIVGPIEVTRGCPYGCKFCATPFLTGGVVRHRSVDSVVHWLRKAVNERGFRRTWFLSPNALCYGGRGRRVVMDQLTLLLKETKSVEGLDLFFGSFPSEVRPEFVTSEILEMFRQYVSNRTLQIGLQSGSDSVLENANRHHTVQEGLDAIDIAIDTGFIPHVDMIFGLPGETEKDVEASLQICEDLASMKANIHGHVFMPLPGSEWESMPAGQLSDRTRQILGEFSRKKIMTGSWSHQESLGKNLEGNQ